MGILDMVFRSPLDRAEKRNISLTDKEKLIELGWLNESQSGVQVTQSSALTYSAVWAAVRIISETVASLPLITYERLDRGKRRARDHYLYPLLEDRPNEKMNAFEFRETKQAHLTTWGNAYSKIEVDGRGRVRELILLRPDKMHTIQEAAGRLFYQYELPNGKFQWFRDDEIWHLRGLGSDGVVGYSVIGYARQSIGLGMAAQEFGARFFGNDARPGVVLEHPGVLGTEAHQNLRESWMEKHGTLSNKHKMAILEEGMTLKEIGIPPEDAQFLQTRQFQIQEVARWFRIPPHMLAHLENATFSNIEHQGIEFVTQSMHSWFRRWEKSIHQSLLLPTEQSRFFAEFLFESLLRGDIQTRYEAYGLGRNGGWLSVNDIREKENMNPIDGGDIYLEPLNMVPAGTQDDGGGERGRAHGAAKLTPKQYRSITNRRRVQESHTPLIRETIARVYKREKQDITRAFKKFNKRGDLDGFRRWLTEFFISHKAFIRDTIRVPFQSFAEMIAGAAADEVDGAVPPEAIENFVERYVESFADRSAGQSEKRVIKAIEEPEPEAALDLETQGWETVRAGAVASDETVQQGSAIAKFVFVLGGLQFIRWVTFGDSCPYCKSLNGRRIGIKSFFLSAGEEFNPADAVGALVPSANIGHPPAHKGCDCGIVGG